MKLFFVMLFSVLALADVEPEVIGGVPTNGYPEAVKLGNGCTASIVGPRAVMTAAHCVGNGGKRSFKVGSKTYLATFTHSPYYKYSHDIALGVPDAPIVGVRPINIYTGPLQAYRVLVIGYGCNVKGGAGVGIKRVASAQIMTISTTYPYMYIIRGQAILCPGDSGGPQEVTVQGTKPKRYQIGINARTNYKEGFATDLTSTLSKTWIKSWANAKKVDVCGITKSCP